MVLAGAGLALVGAAASTAAAGRVGRESGRARRAWCWLSLAVTSMTLGEGVLWILAAGLPAWGVVLAETLPWLVGLPAYAVAVVMLPAPMVRTRRERAMVLLDTLSAAAAATLVYVVMAPPVSVTWPLVPGELLSSLRPWAGLPGIVLLVYLVARCRLPGAIPWGQLRWWLAAVVLYLGLDAVVHLPAFVAAVPWVYVSALVTAVASVPLLVPMTAAADETETPRQSRDRRLVAAWLPVLPLVAAAVVVSVELATLLPPGTLDAPVVVGFAVAFFASLITLRVLAVGDVRGDEARATAASVRDAATTTWFHALLGDSAEIVSILDAEGTVQFQTPSVSRILGYEPGHWLGRPASDLAHPDDAAALQAAIGLAAKNPGAGRRADVRLHSRDGMYRSTECLVTAVPVDREMHGFVLTSRDVTERSALQAELAHRERTDALTGLANRSSLHRHIDESLRGARRGQVAVLTLDLDGFSAVNDALGHDDGDRLLERVGEALERCVRPWDLVARIGGDEFAVLLVSRNAERAVVRVQERIRRALAGVVAGDGSEMAFTASAGYAVNDTGHESAADLLRNADLALARARSARSVELLRFHRDMHDALVSRLSLERELRAAVVGDELFMTYQPVVDLASGRMTGAEALVRWRHRDRGVVAAAEFMPLAEDCGLVVEIGAWVLGQVATDLARLTREMPDLPPFRLGLNVSPKQLDDSLPDQIAFALASVGASASSLVVEVTESSLVLRPQEAGRALAKLRAAGVRVALDDFGTGYSSLGLLAQYEVDILKIDRSFVSQLTSSPEQGALARTIVHLAAAMGLECVAEGVETRIQLELLSDMGCDEAQGYLFAEPLEFDELRQMLGAGHARGRGASPRWLRPTSASGSSTTGSSTTGDAIG
jgi:diguanylate cyclase (GGDEF)-like protein/PAS domain S-box-containing protein